MQPPSYARDYHQQYESQSFETILVRYRRERVLESLRAHPHAHVLEIGCGLDPFFAACDDAERFTVVESVPEFVAAARARNDERVHVIEGYFEQVADALTARRPFDFIVCSSLLHEVPDADALTAAIRGVCDPQTVVHFNVPNMRSFHRLLAYEMGLIESVFEKSDMEKKFGRHTRYDLEGVRALLGRHGFREIASGTYFVKPFTHGQMEHLLGSGQFAPSLLEGLSRMVAYMPELGCELFLDVKADPAV